MEIRKATKDDIEGILALQTQVYRTKETSSNTKELLELQIENQKCDFLVAVENDQLVASGILYYIDIPIRGVPFAFLEALVVDDTARGKGIGGKMIEEFISYAKKRGCYKFIFTSGFDRQDAHTLYEKLGFKKWGYEFRMDL